MKTPILEKKCEKCNYGFYTQVEERKICEECEENIFLEQRTKESREDYLNNK